MATRHDLLTMNCTTNHVERTTYINCPSSRWFVGTRFTGDTRFLLNMKLFTFVTLLCSPLAIGAHLGARQQDNCNRNNCYVAVWGSDPNLVPVRGVVACERHLTTTEIIYPMYVQNHWSVHSHAKSYNSVTSTFAEVTLTTTTTPCPTVPIVPTIAIPSSVTPISTTSLASSSTLVGGKRIKARQLPPSLSSSTTTTFGPVPTYVTGICDTGNYRSACLCKAEFSITSASVTSISTVRIGISSLWSLS